MTETPTRVPAGVPTGGRFAVSARTEATNVHVMPLALESTVPADEALTYTRAESGSEIFSTVEVSRIAENDAFRVTGSRDIDLRAAVMTYFDDDEAGADAWLTENSDVIMAHLYDRYDAHLDPALTDAGAQRILVSTEVACDARIDAALDAIERCHGAQRLAERDDDDLVHGMAQAVNAWDAMLEDHAVGSHEGWGRGGNPECPECESAESRLLDMADALREEAHA